MGGITEESRLRTSGFIAGHYYFDAADRSFDRARPYTGKKVWRYDAEGIVTAPGDVPMGVRDGEERTEAGLARRCSGLTS